jgi:outer membrane PBP1 activator LpoA protein
MLKKMRFGTQIQRACLALCVALIALAGCEMQPAQRERPAANRQLAQAEELAREGDHAGAAQTYETLAAQSQADLRDRLLLRAARERARAGQMDAASNLLARVSTTLPTADYVLRAQVAAEIALANDQPEKALAELERIPQPLSREDVSDVLALRARAQFAMNRPAAGVSTALERERTLSSAEAVRDNQRLIWRGLQRSAAGNADFTAPAGAGATVTGWLELGRAALAAARNPFTATEDLSQWRERFPSHPANELLTQDVLPELGVGLDYPPQIALVLPLSGRQQPAGVAVRDGFLAALLQQEAGRRPLVNIYDSAELGASTAYQRALAEGAQFVVGPLIRDEVNALAASGDVSVPTLALNQATDATAPGLLFQFALDPEEEARQAAQRVMADGRTRGLVLLPNNEWGRRLFSAFDSELQTLGGTIAGMRFYDPTERDYSGPIRALLLIDESRSRANALSAALGSRLEFEPRRRGDAQFVFIGAQPVQGRSLRPALRFHLADDLPVYATSDIFEPDSQGNEDLEGVIFSDMPWVISPDAVSTELRTALTQHWPVRARGRGRLYAFGFDAYRLVPLLKAGRFGREHAVPGMTGLLSVDQQGRVHRELDWARVSNGKATPLGGATSAAIR